MGETQQDGPGNEVTCLAYCISLAIHDDGRHLTPPSRKEVTNPKSAYWRGVLNTAEKLMDLLGYQLSPNSMAMCEAVQFALERGFIVEKGGRIFPGKTPPGQGPEMLGSPAPLPGGDPQGLLKATKDLPVEEGQGDNHPSD